MSKRESSMRRHVRTNVVARIIYRIVCLALIIGGIGGLFMTTSAADYYHYYGKRTEKAVAEVTDIHNHNDPEYDDVQYCDIDYKFKVNNKEYTSKTSWELLPTQANCTLSKDSQITIRYQKGNPTNNAYGDNSQDKTLALMMVIALAIVGIVPLGIGFVGLIAIHKALKEEDDEADRLEAAAAKRRATLAAKKGQRGE